MSNQLLMIDDNPLETEVLASRLQRDGYSVRTTTSGVEGLACLAQESFQLLIVDLDMPGMDGLEVIREVRRLHSYPRIPILMLSASADTQRKVEAVERGADDFLSKPVEYPFLKAKLKQLMGQRPDVHQLAAGQRFAHYELLEFIGAGGMGKVFRALDPRIGREVALKILHHQSPNAVQRFLQEARSIAQVSHAQLPAIYEVADTPLPFLSMELIPGESLQGRSWTQSEAIAMVAEAAEVVHAIHQRGILHRDLKPANLMRTPEGRVKVLDFGLAKFVELEEHLTQSGELLGTPHYTAPENLSSSFGTVDFQSDVYSLTVTLYQLLTGNTPFVSTRLGELLQDIMFQPPPQLGPEFPSSLRAICDRGLAKHKADRFASASELALALRGLLVETAV